MWWRDIIVDDAIVYDGGENNKSCGHGIYSGSTCASNKMLIG